MVHSIRDVPLANMEEILLEGLSERQGNNMFRMDGEAFLKIVNKAVETEYSMFKHFDELFLRAQAKCLTAVKGMKYDQI